MKTNLLASNFLKLIALSILLSVTSSLSMATGKGSDGGADKIIFDETLLQDLENLKGDLLASQMNRKINQDAAMLRGKIESGDLKEELLNLLEDQSFLNSMKSGKPKNLLAKMLADGLIEDIKNTPYEINERCYDEARTSKFLSTRIGVRRSPICVSPTKFYEDYYRHKSLYVVVGNPPDLSIEKSKTFTAYPFWQIAALFLHDHARQFNEIVTDDHGFASAMAIAIFSYPRFFDLKVSSRLETSGKEKTRDIRTTVFVSGLWKSSDLSLDITIPQGTRCAQVREKHRKVLGTESSSLVQRLYLVGNDTIYLDCISNALNGGLMGIEQVDVVIKDKAGREIKSFTAQGGSYWGSSSISIKPLRYKINGESY